MTEAIFGKYAPAYWAKGMPVIPLHPFDADHKSAGKAPIPLKWQDYQNSLPSAVTQDMWLKMHAGANMGLPAGPQSRCVFIDIDSTDPEVIKAVESVLPRSPWKRIGQKGCVYAYRYNGEQPKKISHRLADGTSSMIVEILSAGNQIVMPPSIHPKTKMPYTENCSLLDVVDNLPILQDGIYERLRAALSGIVNLSNTKNGSDGKFYEVAGVGTRDVRMTKFAGTIARGITKGEVSLRRGIDDLMGWADKLTVGVAGDNLDPNKAANKVLEFLKTDVKNGHILPPGWDEGLTPEQKLAWGLDFGEDKQEWTVSQLNDYIFNKFSECSSPNDPKRQEIVLYVLEKLSKSAHLQSLEVDGIISNLQKNSGLGLPKTAYLKQLKALTSGAIEGTSHHQIAMELKEFWANRVGELAFHDGKFWGWTGDHWEITGKTDIMRVIGDEYGNMPAAKKASDHEGIIKVMACNLPQELSVGDVKGVNFLNGFLTQDLKLLEHQSEQGCTYVLPYQYRPELSGRCPKFFDYLHKSWGSEPDYESKLQALREAMAVTLFGCSTSFQRAFLLYGPGGTGKSVMLEIIGAMVPEDAQLSLGPQHWKEKWAPSEFSGKLLNRAGELDEREPINGAVFKQLVTGDPMDVAVIYKGYDKFRSKCAQWFAGNCLPKTYDTSSGFIRRWLIFGFDEVVKKEDRIIELGKEIVAEEVEAIVAWVVECFPALFARGEFTLPPSHLKLQNQMACKNSDIRSWLDERVVVDHAKKSTSKELWMDFWNFQSARMTTKRMISISFHRDLQEILKETHNLEVTEANDGFIYNGIGLKPKTV